ncbi:MAG: hypothetical protein WAX07_09180 [Candidatus Altiarchaeia archaeon]
MDYIKDLITGNANQEHVHAKFVKYSKGTFAGPMISVKKAGNSLKINGSYEYTDTLVGVILKASAGKIMAAGNVFSKNEIKTDLASKSKKKLGVYITEIKGEADAKALLELYNANKEATFYLDLQSGKAKLKTKKKPPKPGSQKDGEFFTSTLDAGMADAVASDVCFDCGKKDYKEMMVSHEFTISELVIPEQYKNDAAKARLNAKRKGTITRKTVVDGAVNETKKELLV